MSQSDQIFELGKRLASQLDLDNSVDTLSRWMSHHIAELLVKAEMAAPEHKGAAEAECRQAILELWKVRHDLPNGRRPFQGFEQIFQSLSSLDATDDTPRYFRAGRPPRNQKYDDSDETRKWLDIADGVDYTARILISFCLGKAAASSVQTARAWLAAVEQLDDDGDIRIVRRIVDESDLLDPSKQSKEKLQLLEKRQARLEGFSAFAALLLEEIKMQLQVLSGVPERSAKSLSPKRAKRIKGKSGKSS